MLRRNRLTLDGSVAIVVPAAEHLAQRGSRPLADFRSVAPRVNLALEVSFPMSLTDLSPDVEGITGGVAIGTDRATKCLPQQRDRERRGPSQRMVKAENEGAMAPHNYASRAPHKGVPRLQTTGA